MTQVYKRVLPAVYEEIRDWEDMANRIPNEELRKQALASICTKTFHCEGGAVYALLAGEKFNNSISFIVAYQTISDYLDNLCDRSTSQDPADFAALHEAMIDALSPYKDVSNKNYYRLREDQDDGGYLVALVQTCQIILKEMNDYEKISETVCLFATHYSNLQIHKHVKVEERVPRLEKWFAQYENEYPYLRWYEFGASSGSTLGIFCLVSYALSENLQFNVEKIKEAYFPWIQGLHIMLDYFIDQEEDRQGGDLNFCFYYKTEEEMEERLIHIATEAKRKSKALPDHHFHGLVARGLVGMYLADSKTKQSKKVLAQKKRLLKAGGAVSYFFYYNVLIYRKLKKGK
jgi:tetraprenyl-beta-curcumene synthase